MHRQRIGVMTDPLRRLLRRGAFARAANLLSKLHAADIVRLLELLSDRESDSVFSLLLEREPKRAGEVLAEMETAQALGYLEDRSPAEMARILSGLASDDAAGLVSALPAEVAEQVLRQLEAAGNEQVEDLLAYEEETAGRVMSTDVFALAEGVTVGEAINALRSSNAEDLEMAFYLYVVDDRGHLVGVCSLRDLLLRSPTTLLKDFMATRMVSVNVHTDQEEVARLVARYNYLAVPVVDDENKLVGIITVDDIIDIIRDEETEDILLMAGVGEDEEEVLSAPLRRNVMLRLPWLFAAWIGGILASQVIDSFQTTLQQSLILALYIPIILGMGGNVGTQAATIVVRGLATGRLAAGQAGLTVLRELRVSLTLGVIFGVLLGAVAALQNPDQPRIGIVGSLSLIASMALAATVGASTPIALRRFGVDPAIATGPFITTSVDVLGIMVYFSIARVLLF